MATLKNLITRKGKFDAGHRVMHERFKCANVHGHEYHYELTFSCPEFEEIGYAIDFKELKRVGCQWIDDVMDHGFIANPLDTVMIDACRALKSKLYIMSLGKDCNPSAENIAKELFFVMSVLLNRHIEKSSHYQLKLINIKLYETVNCYVECRGLSDAEWDILYKSELYKQLVEYHREKGRVEYDDRKEGYDNVTKMA